VRPNERAIVKHTTTPGIGGLPSERALSLAVLDWRPDERCPRRTSDAGLVPGPAPWALFVEEGARAALEMAVVSAAVRWASVGAITLYEASRR
jgi:hypothetical protein